MNRQTYLAAYRETRPFHFFVAYAVFFAFISFMSDSVIGIGAILVAMGVIWWTNLGFFGHFLMVSYLILFVMIVVQIDLAPAVPVFVAVWLFSHALWDFMDVRKRVKSCSHLWHRVNEHEWCPVCDSERKIGGE